MIRKSIAIFLAAVIGAVSAGSDKKAVLDKKFTLSVPHFSQSSAGETKVTPYVAPLESSGSSGTFPASFDLRTTGKVSDVRNQTGYGTCWAHSAIASAESSIIGSNPEINLSEFHTAYYTYSGDDQIDPVSDDIDSQFSRGGNIYAVTNLWAQWIGPVFERRLKYGDTDFFSNEDDVWLMKYLSDYHMKNAYMFDFDEERTNSDEVNNLVKQFVYDGNAVDVSFFSDTSEFYSEEFASTNSNKKPKFANHSVAIVGWDDNFPADNFRIKPESNGAWLAKNSWGTEYGNDGFFWISYEDSSLCEFAVYELEDADTHTNNFFHDTFVSLQSLSAGDDSETNEPSYMANVFYSETGEINIDAVSTYINVPDTEYEITVYTNLEDNSSPVSGTPTAVTRGKQSLTGYVTIPLDDYAYIEEGTYFSVVVKLYSENSPYVIPVETCIAVTDDKTGEVTSLSSFTDYNKIKDYTGMNESFYSANGENWLDVCGEEYVYTDEEEQEILAELEYDLFDGIDPDDTEALENAQLALDVYKDLFANGTTSVAMGNISLKALGSFENWCGFSHNEGVVPDGTKIELYSGKGEDIYYYIGNNYEDIMSGEVIKYTEPIEITDCCTIAIGNGDGTAAYNHKIYIPQSKFKGYGDADGNGLIDAVDASAVLENYSSVSTGWVNIIEPFLEDYADINHDGNIDATDASEILVLYAELSTK